MQGFKILRKLLIVTVVAVTASVSASAQKRGDMAVGGNLEMGTGSSLTNAGIGAEFQYNIINPVRLEGSLTCFFPKKRRVSDSSKSYFSIWDAGVNGHYLFHLNSRLTVYPLAGAGLLITKNSIKADGEWERRGSSAVTSEFGLNLGGGADYNLTKRLFLNAEVKYRIGNLWSRLLVSAGVAYRFN
ncbi:MAG: outer membrane beta-barrel protein [Prevotellaceae bacterium]|jgi:outer membrane protein X|nr:outer membrane beta-barrel protein [Prevotellaceae bacterium]